MRHGRKASVTVFPGQAAKKQASVLGGGLAPMVMPVRAPVSLELDTRRLALISLRADAFVEQVEDVQFGTVVTAGAPFGELYFRPRLQRRPRFMVSDLRSGEARGKGATKDGQPRSFATGGD